MTGIAPVTLACCLARAQERFLDLRSTSRRPLADA